MSMLPRLPQRPITMRRKLTKKELLAATLATGERPKLDRYVNVRFNNKKEMTTGIVFYLDGETPEGKKIRARRGDADEVTDLYSQVFQAYVQATTVGTKKHLPQPSTELPPLGRRIRMRFSSTDGVDTGLTFFMGTNDEGQIVHAKLPASDMVHELWSSMNAVFDTCAIVHELSTRKAKAKK